MDALMREPRTILIALDQSAGAEFAFDWAVKHYCKANDLLHLLYVRRIDDQWLGETTRGHQEAEASVAFFLQKYIERANQAKLVCRARTVVGDEREEICREVLWVCADVLIVGSRDLNSVQNVMRRVFWGSISEYCAQNSACPVIVVRPSNSKKEAVDSSCEIHIRGLDALEDT